MFANNTSCMDEAILTEVPTQMAVPGARIGVLACMTFALLPLKLHLWGHLTTEGRPASRLYIMSVVSQGLNSLPESEDVSFVPTTATLPTNLPRERLCIYPGHHVAVPLAMILPPGFPFLD